MCPLSAPIKYLMGHKISVPAFMSPVTIGQCGDTATGAWELELETKVHPKVRNHRQGPY